MIDHGHPPGSPFDLNTRVVLTDVEPFLDPIPGIIPFGTVTVFAGAPGVGKTAMLADWIVRMRTGQSIWHHATNPSVQYCYLAGDRQWSSHQKWFDLVGYSDIPRYSLVDDPQFDLKELLQPYNALDLFKRSLLRANNGQPPIPGAFVCIDPVAPLFIAGNPNSSRDVARTLIGMSRLCQSLKITLVLTAHFGKQMGDAKTKYTRPQDRIAGSGAFSGFSDTQIYLVDPEPPDQPNHLFGWNPRHQRPEEFYCTRNDRGLFVPYDLLKDDEISAHVCDCISDTGPTSIAVIRERVMTQHGHSRATVTRALDRLITQNRIVRLGRGRYQKARLQ